MTIPILCLVCFFLLCWVLILKGELNRMNKELERSKTLLQTKLGALKEEVKVEGSLSLKGRAAEGSLLRFP